MSVRTFVLVGFATLIMAGCSPIQQPVVDVAGKDPVQLERDRAYCTQVGYNTVGFGNPITKCMKAKGYTILVGY